MPGTQALNKHWLNRDHVGNGADFYLRAQEASMKVDTAGKAQREKLVDNEMIVWARARVRVE